MKFFKKHIVSIISVIVFFVLWQIGSVTKFLPVDYIGTPSNIFIEFINLFNARIITDYLLPSVLSLLAGLSLALVIGVTFGFAIGANKTIEKVFKPLLVVINSVPLIVFFPILIVVFSISFWSVILTIVLMCFPLVMINVIEGINSADPQLLIMAKSFKVSKGSIFKNIILYSSVPYIISSFRSSVGKAIVALVVAELYGLNRGIGYLVSFYGATLQADKLMSLVIFITCLSGLLFLLIRVIEKRLPTFENTNQV